MVAKEILKSGKALDAWKQIVKSQGEKEIDSLGHLTKDIVAEKSGKVKRINTSLVNKIAILAGAGQYAGAGVDLLLKTGDNVSKGDTLYRIYSCNSSDFSLAIDLIENEESPFEIG